MTEEIRTSPIFVSHNTLFGTTETFFKSQRQVFEINSLQPQKEGKKLEKKKEVKCQKVGVI